MQTKDFYGILDVQIRNLLDKYQNDTFLKKNKQMPDNQKLSYGLLIWFIEIYGRFSNYTEYITDGNDDNSCDIIFDKKNQFGERIFYIVQSKWAAASNAEKETESGEIMKALNAFDTLLRAENLTVNEKLRLKIKDLEEHLKANGEVKFIFLTLSDYKGAAQKNIEVFVKNDPKVKFEVFDIKRIKENFIDREYKKTDVQNPLETYRSPEEMPLTLEFIQKNGIIKIEKPFEAYDLLLRPKTVWDLFKKFGFALFFKNVRNPLLSSQYNQDIEKTIFENPSFFWYYNNGITAITSFLPEIGKKTEFLPLTGLQIINGAQTVYSVYRAYEQASPAKRAQMDADSFISLRLLKSGGTKFDLDVTRFTNSQNPVKERDFYANDDVQLRLQSEFYQTNIWYEKRREEFRSLPENIEIISNDDLAYCYLSFHLRGADKALKSLQSEKEQGKNLCFLSHKDHKDGLYEHIFNDKTSFEDLLATYYLRKRMYFFAYTFLEGNEAHFYIFMTLFAYVFEDYYKMKYGEVKNLSKEIIKFVKKGEFNNIFYQVMSNIGFLICFALSKDGLDVEESPSGGLFAAGIIERYPKILNYTLENVRKFNTQAEEQKLKPDVQLLLAWRSSEAAEFPNLPE